MIRAAALALALAFVGCSSAPVPRVVLLGDSITRGRVIEGIGPAYATLLAEAFGDSVELHNVACGGLTVQGWLADAAPAFCQREPFSPNLFQARLLPLLPAAVVVVLLGTNDSLPIGGGVEPDEYGRRMRTLTAQLVENGAGKVLLVRPPFIEFQVRPSMLLMGYGEQVAAICDESPQVVCGPDLFRLLEGADFGAKGPHPNGAGHAKIAAGIELALRPLIGLEAVSPGS